MASWRLAMFKTWKIIELKQQIIVSLWVIIAIMAFMNAYMFYGWSKASGMQRIYFPPDLAKGGVFRIDEIPPGQIYAFGFHIFAGINTWSELGSKDYEKQILSNKSYLSESFFIYLQSEINRKQALNELNRKRVVFDENTGFDNDAVIKISSNTWNVNYRLHIQESIANNVFKEWIEVYPITIQAVNSSIESNPWGLVITGFYKEPYREKNII